VKLQCGVVSARLSCTQNEQHYMTGIRADQLSLMLCVFVSYCASGCPPQVQGGGVISAAERGRAGT